MERIKDGDNQLKLMETVGIVPKINEEKLMFKYN